MKALTFILMIYLGSCGYHKQNDNPKSIKTDSISKESLDLRDSLSASIDALDSLKPMVEQIKKQLIASERLKEIYQSQEAEIRYKPIVDSSALASLRAKLNSANNEIARLNGELASARYRPVVRSNKDSYATFVQPAIETPDENSIIVSLDGRSKKGDIPTENMTIYLVPYNKRTKDLMSYDSSCSDLFAVTAKYYNGIYFFNNVVEGRYIIKICTYMGNYKLIKKQDGKQSITMLVSPPIQ